LLLIDVRFTLSVKMKPTEGPYGRQDN
jgi:hypothetical protein